MSGPECLPFKTVEDVLEFEPENFRLTAATESLVRRIPIASDAPKTILCHDMRGGYLQDRFVQGSPDADSYRFYHWQHIDSFIYFSHYLVTVPPPGWTNTAHRHGVQMMGTLITEWDDGKKRCHQIIESEDSYRAFADKLVEITLHYGMDGWLVNIENVVETNKVQRLCDFVSYLTRRLHDVIPDSQVIWYDSVINTGQLKWQNGLNEKNSMFFDACDGIFLNYNWNDKCLKHSKELASSRGRPMDVYVGVDVFGRGCLGGGGFNTVEALTAIRQNNMSAAIFAMGWVYETQGEADFLQNENRFWSLLHHLLPVRLLSTNHLPFSTSFCQGFGHRYNTQGQEVSGLPWYNLGLQELQPSLTDTQFESIKHSSPSMVLDAGKSFQGGSSLKLEAHPVPRDGSPVIYRLYCMGMEIREAVFLSYTYSHVDTHLDVYMECDVMCDNDQRKKFIFKGNTPDRSHPQSDDTVSMFNTITDDAVLASFPALNVGRTNAQWTTRYYKLDPGSIGNFTISSVNVGLYYPSPPDQHNDTQTLWLGQIQILPESCLKTSVEVSDVTCLTVKTDDDTDTKQLTWKCSDLSVVKYFNVFSTQDGPKLLGHSNHSSFVLAKSRDGTSERANGGEVAPPSSLSVTIQPVLKQGITVPLSSCTKVETKL